MIRKLLVAGAIAGLVSVAACAPKEEETTIVETPAAEAPPAPVVVPPADVTVNVPAAPAEGTMAPAPTEAPK